MSSVITYGSGMDNDPENAFNGIASPNFGGTNNNTIDNWIEFPDASVLGGKRVELYSINGSTSEQYFSFVEGTSDLQRSDPKPSWTDLGIAPANQTRIYCYGTNKPYITMIRVDGKLLVDTGVRNLGDNKVSTVSSKRGEGTIKTINGTAVTIEPFVDNCFKEDQYLVFKTPKVIEVTPLTDSIDSFNSSTNTLTLSGGKDLNQLANGDTIYMTDGIAPINQDGYTLTTTDIESDFVFDYGSQTLSGKSAAAIFDGDPNTYVAFNINASSAGDALVTFDPPIPANKEFVFYQANTDLETNGSWPKFQGFRINGIDVDDERTYVDMTHPIL